MKPDLPKFTRRTKRQKKFEKQDFTEITDHSKIQKKIQKKIHKKKRKKKNIKSDESQKFSGLFFRFFFQQKSRKEEKKRFMEKIRLQKWGVHFDFIEVGSQFWEIGRGGKLCAFPSFTNPFYSWDLDN
jgi:hypothetical protein